MEIVAPFIGAYQRPQFAFHLAEPNIGALRVPARCGHYRYQYEHVCLGADAKRLLGPFFDRDYYWLMRHLPTWLADRLQPERCASCAELEHLRQTAILCAGCQKLILQGDPVQICVLSERAEPLCVTSATIVSVGGFVCCANCSVGYAMFTGIWRDNGVANVMPTDFTHHSVSISQHG